MTKRKILAVHSFTKTELGGIQFAQLPKSSKCVTPKEIKSKRETYKNLCKFLEIRHNSPGYFFWINVLQKEKYPMNFKLTWIDLQKLIWIDFLQTFWLLWLKFLITELCVCLKTKNNLLIHNRATFLISMNLTCFSKNETAEHNEKKFPSDGLIENSAIIDKQG